MKKDNKRSRAELIIDEILCGGFAKCELQDIIDVCEEEIEKEEE